jgi:hypothetical protein
MDWKKVGQNQVIGRVDTRFSLCADKMPDGRWTWKVTREGANAPMASGIVTTSGGAKHAMESFLKKNSFI